MTTLGLQIEGAVGKWAIYYDDLADDISVGLVMWEGPEFVAGARSESDRRPWIARVELDLIMLCNDQKMAVDIADQLGDFNPDDTQRARVARIAAYRDESEEVAGRIAAGDA